MPALLFPVIHRGNGLHRDEVVPAEALPMGRADEPPAGPRATRLPPADGGSLHVTCTVLDREWRM